MASFGLNSEEFQLLSDFCNSTSPTVIEDIMEDIIKSHSNFEESQKESIEKLAIKSSRGALKGVNDYFEKLNQSKIAITGTDIGHPSIYSRNPISKRIFSNCLDIVEVRSSLIHDRGVFAKRDIKKGELITFYPGDRTMFKMGDHIKYSVSGKNFDINLYKNSFLKNYRFDVTEDCYIIGNPNNISDNTYIGHIINDSSKPNNKNNIRKYITETVSRCNAAPILIKYFHVAIVSLRDIVKDEEIFISYGPEYWQSKFK